MKIFELFLLKKQPFFFHKKLLEKPKFDTKNFSSCKKDFQKNVSSFSKSGRNFFCFGKYIFCKFGIFFVVYLCQILQIFGPDFSKNKHPQKNKNCDIAGLGFCTIYHVLNLVIFCPPYKVQFGRLLCRFLGVAKIQKSNWRFHIFKKNCNQEFGSLCFLASVGNFLQAKSVIFFLKKRNFKTKTCPKICPFFQFLLSIFFKKNRTFLILNLVFLAKFFAKKQKILSHFFQTQIENLTIFFQIWPR